MKRKALASETDPKQIRYLMNSLSNSIKSFKTAGFSKASSRIGLLIIAFFALFLVQIAATADIDELDVRILGVDAGDMAYDESRGIIWLSVRASAVEHANSVIGVDPETLEVEQVIPVGPDPVVIALSADGGFLYVGLQGAPGYQQIDLADQTVSAVYPLSSDPSNPLHVADMAVLPDDPEAVAISRRRLNSSGNRGVAIYEAGVARPNQTDVFSPSNQISFGDRSNMLFTFNTEGSGRDFYRMTVDENGVRVADANRGFPAGTFADGWFVGAEGTVFDPYELLIIADLDTRDLSSSYMGPGVADRELKRIFRIYGRSLGIYETNTFTLQRTIEIPGIEGRAVQLVRWGERGLAFRSDRKQLVVLEGEVIAPEGPVADLHVDVSTGPYGAIGGEEVSYRVSVTNAGPDRAESVLLAHSIPEGFELIEAVASAGDLSVSGKTVEVRIEDLPVGETIEATLRVTAQTAGRFTVAASASSETYDPAPLNSTSEAAIHVQPVRSPHRVLAERLMLVDHLVASADGNAVYASVNVDDPHYGNRVVVFDPLTGEVIRTIFAGANPTRMAASADGSYLYVATQNGRNIARVDLATDEVDLVFNFGKQSDNEHRSASDLLILPDAPESLVVGLRAGGYSAGIAVFDNGVMRPNASSTGVGSFTSNVEGDRLYAFSGSSFLRFSVDEAGVAHLDTTRNIATGVIRHVEFADGLVFSPPGQVIDPEARAIHGAFPPAQYERVSVLPRPELWRTLFLESTGLIEAFRTGDSQRMAQWAVPHASGAKVPLVKWGANGLAFAGKDSVFFVETPLANSDKVNLTVAIENPPIDIRAGMEWTYTVRMTNSGDESVTGLRIGQAAQSFLNINEVTSTAGVVSLANGTFEVLVGILDPGEEVVVAVTIQPLLARAYLPRVQIASVEADEDPSRREWPLSFTARRAGTLSLELPADAAEGDGLIGGGRVSTAESETFDVQVNLASSVPGRLAVPETVTILAGQTEVSFDLTVIDDDVLNGRETVTVSATAGGFTTATASIAIRDNEEFAVSVHLPESAHQGASVTGEVRLDRVAHSDFPIGLSTEDGDWLVLPQQVVIPAGADRAEFAFSVRDREIPMEGQIAAIRAEAFDGTGDRREILLLPPEPASPINPMPSPNRQFVTASPVLTWNDTGPKELIVNGGFSTGDFRGWRRESTGAGGWAINDGNFDPPGTAGPKVPFEGPFGAVSYQNGSGTNRLIQEVEVPYGAEGLRLSWAASIYNGGPRFRAESQEFKVEISGEESSGGVVFRTNPGHPLVTDWETVAVNISDYLEPRLTLEFVETDSEGYLNVFLDNVSMVAEFPEIVEFEGDIYQVYLGTSPDLQVSDLVASVDAPFLSLEDLELGTTYYWKIVVIRGAQAISSPVWSFQTAPIDVAIVAPQGPTVEGPLEFRVVFSEPVVAPSVEDFVIQNGAEATISGEGAEYVLSVVPQSYGYVSLHLPGNVVHNDFGAGSAESTVAKVFYGGAASFDRWREFYFTAEERDQTPNLTGPLDDAGNAGVVHLLRYAFGMLDGEVDFDRLPRVVKTEVDGKESIGLVFHWQAGATDIEYVVEVSKDLKTWSNGGAMTEVVSTEGMGLTRRITVGLTEDAPADGSYFLRLRIREVIRLD